LLFLSRICHYIPMSFDTPIRPSIAVVTCLAACSSLRSAKDASRCFFSDFDARRRRVTGSVCLCRTIRAEPFWLASFPLPLPSRCVYVDDAYRDFRDGLIV
jgi:hypothetical protein